MLPNIPVLTTPQIQPIVIREEKKEAPKPVEYIIKENDNLTKIAEAHSSSVSRLWSANPQLTDPDRIEPGKPLKIPQNGEQLVDRPMPVAPAIIKPSVASSYTANPQVDSGGFASSRTGRSTPGWYYAGQCTRWVADHRYVPDGWGDASDWKWHAQAEGWTVSSTPVAGAIGWKSGHVVYVISVGNGVVTISEQNYDWKSSVRTITVPTSKYTYIY